MMSRETTPEKIMAAAGPDPCHGLTFCMQVSTPSMTLPIDRTMEWLQPKTWRATESRAALHRPGLDFNSGAPEFLFIGESDDIRFRGKWLST